VLHASQPCSKACQRKDWKKQHKQICKVLNVGHGDMQPNDIHRSHSIALKKQFEEGKNSLGEKDKRFFKLFRAAALEMKQLAKRKTKQGQEYLLFHSVHFLIRSDSKMLLGPNSPLLLLLQFVDPNMLFGNEETSVTLLHDLVDLADSFDYLRFSQDISDSPGLESLFT
jgi:hypothetical protein